MQLIKQFLKPEWKKIIILVFFLGIIFLSLVTFFMPGNSIFSAISKFLLLPLTLTENLLDFGLVIFLLIIVIYWYILSCTIVYLYNKIRNLWQKGIASKIIIIIFALAIIVVMSFSVYIDLKNMEWFEIQRKCLGGTLDMKKTIDLMESYYSNNHKYPQGSIAPDLPGFPKSKAPEYCPYIWLDNTNNDQQFCIYVVLYVDSKYVTYYTASHRGVFKDIVTPTLEACGW